MNPWGALYIIVGALMVFIGLKGTQNGVWKFLTGNAPGAASNTPFAPSDGTTPSTPTNSPGGKIDPTTGRVFNPKGNPGKL